MQLLRPDWDAPATVQAVVTTREGGISTGPWTSLNLATHVGDDPRAVHENRARLASALALPGSPHWLSQVHGIRCVDAAAAPSAVEADAAFATLPGVVCAVLTADCLPVLLADRAATRVAAVHAGWRGLHAGVIAASIAALDCAPDELCAWIGPGIGTDAYVVGDDLRARFLAADDQYATCFMRREQRWHADLAGIATRQLTAAGVPSIARSGLCTCADTRFYSYRRDGTTGRFATLIWIDPSSPAP